MQHIVSTIHSLLIKSHKTVAVAESCTGGLLSELLTDIPGGSKYFLLGVVAYSNKAKETLLRIPRPLLTRRGAVSKEVAKKMAESIRKLAKADFGIGITGIAGPTGGSPDKPIGTVFIAIDTNNKKICKKFNFAGNRTSVRNKAALKALELLKILL
jgi:nicotinamide-nucleotide amidase